MIRSSLKSNLTNGRIVRSFSTPQSPGLTPDQIKKEVDRVDRFRKFASPSCMLFVLDTIFVSSNYETYLLISLLSCRFVLIPHL